MALRKRYNGKIETSVQARRTNTPGYYCTHEVLSVRQETKIKEKAHIWTTTIAILIYTTTNRPHIQASQYVFRALACTGLASHRCTHTGVTHGKRTPTSCCKVLRFWLVSRQASIYDPLPASVSTVPRISIFRPAFGTRTTKRRKSINNQC
jgi:hypothetical protein